MPYKDYSNTEIFDRNTAQPGTKEINAELKAMYTAFYKNIRHKVKDSDAELNGYGYNGVQLLTCFDSYIESINKIMVYGKEAHTDSGRLLRKNPLYQKDEYYRYDYAIAHRNDENSPIPASDCPETQYLKTRKIICGIKEDEKPSEDRILSFLNNNLNKSSIGGNYTPCNKVIDKLIYGKFEYYYKDSKSECGNIYWHELKILKPTHLLFISGKGYDEHIKRDFGGDFYKSVIETLINQLKNGKSDCTPTSDIVELNNTKIKEYLRIPDYFDSDKKTMRVMYAYHPSARLSDEVRKMYNEKIKAFIGK